MLSNELKNDPFKNGFLLFETILVFIYLHVQQLFALIILPQPAAVCSEKPISSTQNEYISLPVSDTGNNSKPVRFHWLVLKPAMKWPAAVVRDNTFRSALMKESRPRARGK